MTGKPRCTKVKYPTLSAALAVIRRKRLAYGFLRAYRCGKHNRACYHLTSRVR